MDRVIRTPREIRVDRDQVLHGRNLGREDDAVFRQPDFDGANLQGVQRDSLEGFKSIGGVEEGDTPMLRTFLARAASAIILYVL